MFERGNLLLVPFPFSDLSAAKRRSFPKPTSRQIAVKVINHYGDEVLKVFEVR